VSGGQLKITSFGAEEVRCLSLLVTTIAHFTSDGKCISFPLLYYVDSLVQGHGVSDGLPFFCGSFV
jgi:hypothetical protein